MHRSCDGSPGTDRGGGYGAGVPAGKGRRSSGFGGNGTIIGSTANVVVTSLSERTRYPITPALWNKRGLRVMLVTCTVASILYALVYPIFTR